MSIITITGPTCAGKTTLERALQRLGCGRVISHTTRPPRAGEVDGHDYHYVSDGKFSGLEESNQFVEIVDLGVRRYGTSKTALEAACQSQHAAIVVDPHGASQIRSYCENNNIPVFSAWVDCGVKEQVVRFMGRIMDELVTATGTADVMLAAAERLEMMMTIENEWRAKAKNFRIDDRWGYHKMINSAKEAPFVLASSILSSLPDQTLFKAQR